MSDENTRVDYMVDVKGRQVPRRLVKDVDVARDSLVRELFAQAEGCSAMLAAFKNKTMADIQAFIELSAEQYGAAIGGNKGNVTLISYDGRYKVQRQIAESITFDERLQAAKTLIDSCVRRWSEGANDNIRALVEHAFQVDKAGKVSTERVLGLRRLSINDPQWIEAMAAISDSITVCSSKAYVRFYERIGETDQWRPLSLDLASVEAR